MQTNHSQAILHKDFKIRKIFHILGLFSLPLALLINDNVNPVYAIFLPEYIHHNTELNLIKIQITLISKELFSCVICRIVSPFKKLEN